MPESDYGLIEVFKENWQHARHVENERISFTQFFAMVVGVAVTIAFQNTQGGRLMVSALATFVFFLALLGLLLTNRWGQTFDTHMQRATKAAEKLGLTDYVVTPGKYYGLAKLRRTRYLFCYYYAVVIGLASGAIIYNSIVPDLTIAGGSSVAVFILAGVFTVYDRKVKSPDLGLGTLTRRNRSNNI